MSLALAKNSPLHSIVSLTPLALSPARTDRLYSGIGCAGEVRISKHEDFDKWAIDILVKFREKEKLQLLTGQRQSGGVS